MEKSILLEIQYLPSLQYVSKLLQYSKVYLEQHENYSKGSYRNRCHIAGAQGLQRLSIPLEGGKHQQQPIREVCISNDESWQSQHWTSIKSAYGKSPFFEHYADVFLPFYKKKYTYLWDWNWDLLQQILPLVSIESEIGLTTQYEKNPSSEILDFRNVISPKNKKMEKGFDFISPKYVQVFEDKNEFVPNLSILDLLFCTGPEAAIIL